MASRLLRSFVTGTPMITGLKHIRRKSMQVFEFQPGFAPHFKEVPVGATRGIVHFMDDKTFELIPTPKPNCFAFPQLPLDLFLSDKKSQYVTSGLEKTALTRLMHDLIGDRIKAGPTFKEEFAKFCERVPAWSSCGDPAFLVWKKYPQLEQALILRRQMSSLCYMLAPAVLQSYLVAIETGYPPETLNLSHYISTKLQGATFDERVVLDKGGPSLEFLNTISGVRGAQICGAIALPSDPDWHAEHVARVISMLENDGPALVSRFRVYADFHTNQCAQFHGGPKGELKGMHAMLLLGHRKEADRVFFLLQNWWDGKYFVEVDSHYLSICSATISTFPEEVRTEYFQAIPTDLPTISAPYAETDADMAEGDLYEGAY